MGNYPKFSQYRLGATTKLDVTSVTVSTGALGAQTYGVRIAANTPIHFRIFGDPGISSVCTSADPVLPLQCVEVVGITPSQSLSFVKASGGAVTSADGLVTVTQLL
jgi:hypothetical protein